MNRNVEIDIDRVDAQEVFGKPERAPEGLIVGKVRPAPAIHSVAPSKTTVNPNLTEQDIRHICTRKIIIFLDKIEEGYRVRYDLGVFIRAQEAQVEEQHEEVDYFRKTLGFGQPYFHAKKQKYLLMIPTRYQLWFLRKIRPYAENTEEVEKAIEFLELKYVPIFKKGEDRQKEFEERFEILLG